MVGPSTLKGKVLVFRLCLDFIESVASSTSASRATKMLSLSDAWKVQLSPPNAGMFEIVC